MTLSPLRPDFAANRDAARLVAVHILARIRYGVVKRIDLAPTPGGIGTPSFGPDHRVVRISGDLLIDETTQEAASTRIISWGGLTLPALAEFAGVVLDPHFSAGHDTPELTDAALHVEAATIRQLGEWFAFGEIVLDRVLGDHRDTPLTTRARIWPEHFDLGVDIAAPNGQRLNLGASPGDGFHDHPYLYVAPWDADRPGDGAYWNAPFGAVIGHADLRASAGDDPFAAGVAFLETGIARFT